MSEETLRRSNRQEPQVPRPSVEISLYQPDLQEGLDCRFGVTILEICCPRPLGVTDNRFGVTILENMFIHDHNRFGVTIDPDRIDSSYRSEQVEDKNPFTELTAVTGNSDMHKYSLCSNKHQRSN